MKIQIYYNKKQINYSKVQCSHERERDYRISNETERRTETGRVLLVIHRRFIFFVPCYFFGVFAKKQR